MMDKDVRDYTKGMSDMLTDRLDDVADRVKPDAAVDVSAEAKIKCLQSLVKMLESAMVIMKSHFEGGVEPFPGVVKQVPTQALAGVEIARKTGLIP